MPLKFKTISFVFAAIICSTVLVAHEFWLMPNHFKIEKGTSISLDFFVGENFTGELWGKRKQRLLSLTKYSTNSITALTKLAQQSDSLPVQLNFKTEGTHLISMQSKNSFIALEAEKFNEYLIDDGMEDILELRKQNGEINKPSKELYRRCAKTIIQVGNKTDNTFAKNTGMPLEIIPLQNPYTLTNGDKLTVKVLFFNKILPNKMVLVWHKTKTTKTRMEKLKTDENGLLNIIMDKKGYWMVSTVQMVPIKNNPKANYQSYWANLTFSH